MKIFILLFLFSFTLLANQSNSAKEGLLHEAIIAYKSEKFNRSYELLSNIYLENLLNIQFNFMYGRSAFESGHYEAALAAFERVEMQDPLNVRNKLEIARTYYMLNMYEDSQNSFNDVLKNKDIPEEIKINIENSLARVTRLQQHSFTSTTLAFDILYDSNLNYGSIDDYQYGGNRLAKIDEISDFASQFYIDIVNLTDFGNKHGFSTKQNLSIYKKNYFNEYSYDMLFLSYTMSLIYKETYFSTELLGGMDTIFLSDKQYFNSLYLTPQFSINHTNTLRSIVHLKYQTKFFVQDEQRDLDATKIEFLYGLQKTLSPHSYMLGNILAIKEQKVRGDNIYVNFNEYKINTTYVNQFTSTYSFNFYAEIRNRRYKDYSQGFQSTRDDIGGIANIGATINILPTFQFKLKTTFEYINSNQDRFSYLKQLATVGLVKIF